MLIQAAKSFLAMASYYTGKAGLREWGRGGNPVLSGTKFAGGTFYERIFFPGPDPWGFVESDAPVHSSFEYGKERPPASSPCDGEGWGVAILEYG
jgi:hypothetical protein